jgi:short-subunit dehydrogenase
LEKVKSNCASGVNIIVQPLDIGKHNSFQEITNTVIEKMGKIDVLVNNAGISQRSMAKDTDFAVYERLININLLGTIGLTKAVLPHFIQNQSGYFVTITSLMGKFATPLRSGYAAAKHGLHGFFDALRLEHYSDNIKVTLVTPGFVKTNISINALVADGSKQNTMDEGQANGITPEQLAKMLLRDMKKGKREVYYGGLKEGLALKLKRFAPGILEMVLRNQKVT